jgi:inner membrane transporter RhtA
VFYAVSSMLCIQLGLAVSVGLLDRTGPAGLAWLRLAWSAVILLALVRPRLPDLTRTNLLLGVVTAGLLLTFMGAVARLPMGMATALEFLGPLGLAVAHGQGRARLVWPVLAGLGVLLLTEPWAGVPDPIGVALALAAAVFWATYILLTQRAGDEASGVRPLAVSFPVAALVGTGVVLLVSPASLVALDAQMLATGAGLAVLVTLLPFSLELLALRRVPTTVFGVLMAVEPALACVVGALLLGQGLGAGAAAGVLLVVAAGIGAERAQASADPLPHLEPAPA